MDGDVIEAVDSSKKIKPVHVVKAKPDTLYKTTSDISFVETLKLWLFKDYK